MRRNLFLINAVLLVLFFVVGSSVRKQWRDYRRTNNPARIKAESQPKETKSGGASPVPETLPAQAGNYNVIFERNLFSPNRVEFEPTEPSVEAPATPPMPGTPVLTGLTVIGNKKLAFIQEPRAGAQPQNRTVQVGDSIMNFGKITEIRSDALVFTWGSASHVVEMIGGDSPRAKSAVASRLQTTVISIGAKGGKGGSAKGMPAASPTQPGGVPAVGGGVAPVPTIQVSTVGPGGAGAAQVGGRRGAAGGATQGQSGNQGFIDTPFGRVARPAPRTN